MDLLQRMGASDLDTYVSNALEGIMDHDVQNVVEEVSTQLVKNVCIVCTLCHSS